MSQSSPEKNQSQVLLHPICHCKKEGRETLHAKNMQSDEILMTTPTSLLVGRNGTLHGRRHQGPVSERVTK